jgi:hypothetical protein
MNQREAEDLLPWFIAGTLSDEESQAVQAFIDDGGISSAELDTLRTLSASVVERHADDPVYNPAILERAMGQLRSVEQDQPQVPLVVREASSTTGIGSSITGLFQRLLEGLQWSATPPMARIALIGQMALVLGLAAFVGSQQLGEPDVISTTVAGTSIEQTADFTLAFAPGATEAEIRALLIASEITIVAGPSALGMYQVAASPHIDLTTAAAALSADPLITFLQAVPRP